LPKFIQVKKYKTAIILFLVFEAIAISLWLTTGSLFYLLNFSYIGIWIAVGDILMVTGCKYAREFVQFAVGSYMLVFLGLICHENMQIEGFWYYLLSGFFGAGVLHYAIAKIFGPLLFGRGWCGYACWTAMILDLLPYKQPSGPRKRIGWIRYVMFALALALVILLFRMGKANKTTMFHLFLAGNLFYYTVGIILAIAFKDNRAFCKYICPITVFLKPMSYFSVLRIKCDEEKCIHCDKCLKVCPMDVEVNCNSRNRKNATECILCQKCKKACPVKALK
jgi:polyferredoxin